MGKALRWFYVLALAGLFMAPRLGVAFLDEPETRCEPGLPYKAVTSYGDALRVWKTPEDIAGWICAHFTYDRERARELSETLRATQGQVTIYEPSDFFDRKTGVCVDLARFAVETLSRIDPASQPKYLMIEFEPMEVEGVWLRRHWLASFRREGKVFFFADSRRPGHIAGPFESPFLFVQNYERYRQRKILRFQESDSYQKKRRSRTLKRQSRSEILCPISPGAHADFLAGPKIPNRTRPSIFHPSPAHLAAFDSSQKRDLEAADAALGRRLTTSSNSSQRESYENH